MRTLKIIFLFFFICNEQFVFANPVNDSSSNLSQHSFSQSQMNEWRAGSAFQYQRKAHVSISLWDIIQEKIYDFFRKIFSTSGGKWSFWIIVFVLSVAIITFFIVRYKTKMNAMFLRKNEQQINFSEVIEDIHSLDFPAQISNALKENNYRVAIRLEYLQLLKFLSEKEFIHWRSGKTNDEYVYEIAKQGNQNLYHSFKGISRLFDYVWYGETQTTREEYDECTALARQSKDECKYLNKKETTVA